MRHHHKIILISSGALILLVLGLFIYSGYSFKRNSESYKTLSNSMESVSSFSNAMTLNDTINYSTLIRYSDASSKYLHDLKLLNSKIEASLLFKVFQGSSREALLKKMAVLSAYHNSLSESCVQAINDMQPLQKEMHKCNRNYQNHCNKLAGLLTVNNDISDFENYRQEIPALVKEHQKFEKEVQKHIKNHQTSDQTDTLVQLMLNGYASKLQYQLKAFSNNAEKLSDAAKRLSSYKSDMNSMISENHGFFTMIQQIASQYGSIVTKVNYRIEPLHQAFDMLEEPIISNKALKLFTGGKSSYSALDLIQEIDPMTGKTIKTTKVVCDGIEDLSEEIEQIMDITNPYLASVKSFRRSNTRNDQLKLVESSPKLSNYMLSKRKLFAPISSELDKARDDIRQIENVAHQLRVPQAKKYVNQFTTAADDIVDYAYVPFNRWESYVRKITSSLDKMVAMEKKYTSYLSSINDKYMDHKNGKKITNDTRPESNTKKEDIDVHETADNSPSETSSTKDDVEYTTKPSENKTFTDSKNGKKKTNDSRPESNTKKEDIDVHETADNSPSETSSTKDDVEYTTKPSENKTSTDSRDGQTYKYVKIGNQYWMAENLNYDAGSGSWVYDNNSSNATTYGRLYDWETACNVCPDGWHLPSDAEWTELTDYLGGENVVGGKMKETGTSHWSSPNEGATNESGFSALPGGCHVGNGNFNGVGSYARFWSSTETNSYNAWFLKLVYDYSVVYYRNYPKGHGFSVRCVKD